jgi:hypothetical protein
LIFVPLTRVGCTAIFPLHNRLVEFTVLIFVHDTKVSCTATFQLPNNEVEFTVLILVQLTNLSCLFHRAVARLALSVGCHAIALKLTSTAVFFCNNQAAQSYIYTSHCSTVSVSTVVLAVHV